MKKKSPNCFHCGKIKPNPNAKFCTMECYYEYRRSIIYIRTCPVCNKEYSFKNGAYARLGRMKYCSNQCKNRKYIFNEEYFYGELDSEKLKTLGQLVVCTDFYEYPIINFTTDEKTLNDIQTKLGMNHKQMSTEFKLKKIKFKSQKLFDSLLDLGIIGDRFYQDVPRDDLWEGLKSTHCYKEEGDICTFQTESSKVSRWIQDKFNTEIVTKLFRLNPARNKLCCYYINVWKKNSE